MADARLRRTREHYPEGCPQFGAAPRQTECERLGHVYGRDRLCLFCRERQMAPGWTKTSDPVNGDRLTFTRPLDGSRLDIGPVQVCKARLRPELEWRPEWQATLNGHAPKLGLRRGDTMHTADGRRFRVIEIGYGEHGAIDYQFEQIDPLGNPIDPDLADPPPPSTIEP